MEYRKQDQRFRVHGVGPGRGPELVIPNPKLKLMDQVREAMRLKHYAIRTEQAYCEWIGRYVRFHGMRSREELFPGREKVEQFLSDLVVNGHVAASTLDQAFSARRKGTSNVEHRTSDIERRTSNIERRTSNIERRTSNVEHRTLKVEH